MIPSAPIARQNPLALPPDLQVATHSLFSSFQNTFLEYT